MKKEWVKPIVSAEEFVANECVAACYGFADTKFVIKVNGEFSATDGSYNTTGMNEDGTPYYADWNNAGFGDDGFDYLVGKSDTYVGSPYSTAEDNYGWYCDPAHFKSGVKIKQSGSASKYDIANGGEADRSAYYLGKAWAAPLNATNCTQYGCGPNAS